MTSPLPPGDDVPDDEDDELAESLLADAVAASGDDQPARGEPTTTPDMGDQPMTAPANAPQQTAPAPAPAPDPAPPAPAPAPPAAPGTGQQDGSNPGFPPNTPWRDMTAEQQVAYWQHQARKHESRVQQMSDYDELRRIAEDHQRLVESTQTEHERAVAEARRQGASEARLAVGNTTVEAMVRAAAHNWNDEERVNTLLRGLNRAQFINPNTGEVDVNGVYAFVGALAPVAPVAPAAVQQPAPGQPGQPGQPAPVGQPATGGQPGQPAAPGFGQPAQVAPSVAPVPTPDPPRVTDFGQGEPAQARPTGLAAGREIARARFGKQGAGPSTQQQ